jgi:outer membrane protein assembly factor BamB
MPQWGWVASPFVAGDALVVEPGGSGSSRAAVNKFTGEILWKAGSAPAAFSSPILFDRHGSAGIALFNAGGLVAISPGDGAEIFRQPWKTSFNVNAIIPVHRDGKFFIGSAYGKGIALVSPAEGLIWKSPISLHFQNPVLYGEHLYFVGGEAEQPAVLQCLEWATGKVCWERSIGRERGHLIVVDGKLIIITQDGELILADASPAACRERGRFQAVAKRVFAAPAFSDRRLFVRNNDGTLLCYDMTP